MRVSHPPPCESCDRLREANRRLQAEGPALERDKLIIELRAALAAQTQRAETAERERDEAVRERNSERKARDGEFEEAKRLRDLLAAAEATIQQGRALAGGTVAMLDAMAEIEHDRPGQQHVPGLSAESCWGCDAHITATQWRAWAGK